MTIEQIGITIAAIAAIASAVSARYSRKSAEISRETLDYSQRPVLTMEYQAPFLILRNIGLGTAKSVTWAGDENINIPGEPKFTDILLPFHGPISFKEEASWGSESITKRISFGLLNNAISAKVFVEYGSLFGKKFKSEVIVTRREEHQYTVRLVGTILAEID